MNSARGPTYVELVNDATRLAASSISPATTDGMNALVKFVSDGYVSKTGLDGQIGRSVFVKAEDEAFIRQLQVQILGLVRRDMGYIPELLMPLQYTRDTKIRWNKIKFAPQALVRNPAMGTNYTHERTETQDEGSAKRYGEHFVIEGDAWYTEKGQQDFAMNMAYWAVCISDTVAMTAWTELVRPRLESRRKYFDQVKNELTFNQAVIRQRDDTFAPYKTSKGIYPIVQDNCEILYNNSGKEANIMVMPREKSGLITNGTPISTFQNGGERGLDLLMSKGALGEVVPGLKVFPPPKFSINPAYDAATPLDADIRIGSWAEVKFSGVSKVPLDAKFEKYTCLRKFYDENEDAWKSLPNLIDCIKYSGRFKAVKSEKGETKYKLIIPNGFRTNPGAYQNDPFKKLYATGIEEIKTAKEWAEWCDGENCRFLIAAPFAGYRTQGALTAAAGEDAGITTMSAPIVSKGEDPMAQVFKFNMTFWAAAYVFRPECFLLSRNLFYHGILGGGAVKLISEEEADALPDKNWENNRIDRASMYFMIVGEEGDFFSDYIDLRGKSPFGSVETYPCSAFYTERYRWDEIDDGMDEFVSQPIAPICFRREYNHWDGNKYNYVPGETHHGKVVGVGCREMRRYGKAITEHIVTEASLD